MTFTGHADYDTIKPLASFHSRESLYSELLWMIRKKNSTFVNTSFTNGEERKHY